MKPKLYSYLFLLSSILFFYLITYILIGLLYPLLINNLSSFPTRIFNLDSYAQNIESLTLTLIYVIILFFSGKFILSFITTYFFYITYVLINYIKIKLLYSPFLPVDFVQIKELYQSTTLFFSFLPYSILYFILLTSIIILIYKIDLTTKLFKIKRIVLAVFLFLVLFLCFIYQKPINSNLRSHGIFYKKNSNLVIHYLTKGFLTSFIQILFFSTERSAPPEYNINAIKNIIKKYNLNEYNNEKKLSEPINLIVLMVESLTYPPSMDWKTNYPVLSTFSENIPYRGVIYSPVIGGKSINAEFELLTGFSNKFTTIGSLVYRESLSRPIPSIARFLKGRGYNTLVMRDEPIDLYGFNKIYDFLGFDSSLSFTDMNLPKDPTGVHTSSLSIANTIIEKSKHIKPFFIFNFTMSSHAPWNGEKYNSNLDFIYKNKLTPKEKNLLKGYLNSIEHMNIAIKKLLDYFKNSEDKVAIFIVGDHQPMLNNYRFNYSRKFIANNHDFYLANHRMDAILWDNFSNHQKPFNVSMNFSPSILFQKIGIQTCGFMKFNNILRTFFNIVMPQYTNSAQKNIETSDVLFDYNMIQYDIIYGKNYYSKLINGNCF